MLDPTHVAATDDADYYIALGDSISIDLYPQLDLQARGRIAPSEAPAVGAAALFHRNHDALYPEFCGRDLVTRIPDIQQLDLCVDGATIGHTLDVQLAQVDRDIAAGARVVTVTAGGNDLLGGLFDGVSGIERVTERAMRHYAELVEEIMATFPRATVLLTTVYDPTDGTGELPGLSESFGTLPMQLLDRFNAAVVSLAAEHDRAVLADIHGQFLGHGLTAPGEDCWYWATSPIEPGARGASEVRRVWLEALSGSVIRSAVSRAGE